MDKKGYVHFTASELQLLSEILDISEEAWSYQNQRYPVLRSMRAKVHRAHNAKILKLDGDK